MDKNEDEKEDDREDEREDELAKMSIAQRRKILENAFIKVLFLFLFKNSEFLFIIDN